jgi:hypothetical protein
MGSLKGPKNKQDLTFALMLFILIIVLVLLESGGQIEKDAQ